MKKKKKKNRKALNTEKRQKSIQNDENPLHQAVCTCGNVYTFSYTFHVDRMVCAQAHTLERIVKCGKSTYGHFTHSTNTE